MEADKMIESTPSICISEIDLLASATDDELVVAGILLDLPNIMSTSKPEPELKWGQRRSRGSTLGHGASSPRAHSSASASLKRADDRAEEKMTEEGVGAAATSPITPLSFSPSESDDKSRNASKKSSQERSREEYADVIDELTQRRNLLRGEIENVKKYYNELKAYNSQLKEMKQKVLNSCQGKEETQHHQQPLVLDPTADKFRQSFGPITPRLDPSSYDGPRSLDHVGPLGIPDLNLCAEEVFCEVDVSPPLDEARELADRRSRYAEARMVRKQIMKEKSLRTGGGIKLPNMRK